MQSEIAHGGSWFKRNNAAQNNTARYISPAGARIPKALKLAHTEKIPYIKRKQAHFDEGQMKNEVQDHQIHVNEKYGNRSNVGHLISMNNTDPKGKRLTLDKDIFVRKVRTRNCSEFNQSEIAKRTLELQQ